MGQLAIGIDGELDGAAFEFVELVDERYSSLEAGARLKGARASGLRRYNGSAASAGAPRDIRSAVRSASQAAEG